MNVLIAEYFTGGGLCGGGADLPDELRREGELMTRALVGDLAAAPGVRVSLTRDRRLPAEFAAAQVHPIGENEDWTPRLRELLDAADAFWPVAPETGGVLAALCELCEQSGRLLLNSSSSAVRCASSKKLTADALSEAGVPCVETWRPGDPRLERAIAEQAAGEQTSERFVVKPDDGVGCEEIRLVTAAAAREIARAGDVIQPYVEGRPASMNVLYGGGEYRVAGLNLQEIERRGGGFSLKACTVNGLRGSAYDFDAMAARLQQAIPGLAGHVGVDFLVCGEEVRVLEVNPRLTTSYAGLHRSLGVNPAACVLSLLARGPGRPVSPVPKWDLGAAAEIRVEP